MVSNNILPILVAVLPGSSEMFICSYWTSSSGCHCLTFIPIHYQMLDKGWIIWTLITALTLDCLLDLCFWTRTLMTKFIGCNCARCRWSLSGASLEYWKNLLMALDTTLEQPSEKLLSEQPPSACSCSKLTTSAAPQFAAHFSAAESKSEKHFRSVTSCFHWSHFWLYFLFSEGSSPAGLEVLLSFSPQTTSSVLFYQCSWESLNLLTYSWVLGVFGSSTLKTVTAIT